MECAILHQQCQKWKPKPAHTHSEVQIQFFIFIVIFQLFILKTSFRQPLFCTAAYLAQCRRLWHNQSSIAFWL
jgi:hypothetical protein